MCQRRCAPRCPQFRAIVKLQTRISRMASSVVSQLSQYTWLDSIPLNVETSDVDHVPAPKRAKTQRASSSLSVMIPEPMSPSSSGPGKLTYVKFSQRGKIAFIATQ